MLNKIKDKFSYISVVREKNKWKSMYESLNNNFMKSSYKHLLDYENQKRLIEELEEEVKRLKEFNKDIKKNMKLKSDIKRLKKGDVEQNG